MVSVDAKALRVVLQALIGPPHHIRELQMTRSVAAMTGEDQIQTLLDDYNTAVVGGGPPRCAHCIGTGYAPAGVLVGPPQHRGDCGIYRPSGYADCRCTCGVVEVAAPSLREVLQRIVKCDDDAKAAHGNKMHYCYHCGKPIEELPFEGNQATPGVDVPLAGQRQEGG